MKTLRQPWILVGLILFLTVGFFSSCTRIPNLHKAPSFSFQYPAGWKKVERQMYPPFDLESKGKSYHIAFDCPDVDPQTGDAFASLSFYVVKPTTQVWLEDEFASIIQMFMMNGFTVMDKGEIKIDEQVSNWLVYSDPQNRRICLEFFVVNDNNILFRVQYSAKDDKFSLYRQAFENARNTIKLSRW